MNHYLIKMKFIPAFFALIVFIVFSCTSRERHDSHEKSKAIQRIDRRAKLEEAFVDSVRIGRSGFNKVSIFKYRTEDSNYVEVKFYKKLGNDWKLIQEVQCSKDGDLGCDPKFADFNQDGRDSLKEFAWVSLMDKLVVYETDKNGESNKIFEDASINIDDFGFQRFKNYKPWKIYKD